MPRPRIDAAGLGGSERVGYGVAGSNPAIPTPNSNQNNSLRFRHRHESDSESALVVRC